MKHLRLILALVLLVCSACGTSVTETPTAAPSAAPTWTPRPEPAATSVLTVAPAPPTPEPTSGVTAVPLATMTTALSATVMAELPLTPTPDASGGGGVGIAGVHAQSLVSPSGWPQLWAVASSGASYGDPEHPHFVAMYAYANGAWQQLDRAELPNDDQFDGSNLTQVQVEPQNIWLEAQGFAGAHSGCYDLLRFDGKKLHNEASSCSSSPGNSRLEDVNGDGTPDVVLDATDYYVFCYACGVRLVNFSVRHWDGQKMIPADLAPLPEAASELDKLTNQAVALAQAGFWKDAQATISQTLTLGTPDAAAAWDAGLIRLTAQERAAQAGSGAYPLLDHLFYGDYPAALDVMRGLPMTELWSTSTPLVKDTTAEGWEQPLTDAITQTTDLALTLKPELAAAHFLRGWAIHLTDQRNPAVLTEIERAAQLDPNERLFAESLAYLRKQ